MNKKVTALLILLCFTLSCINFTVAASSVIPDEIQGPAMVLKPADDSVTKVKYTLLDDEGNPIDNTQVSWSASNGLSITQDGYVLLNKNIPDGTYTINAECGGVSAPAKSITVKAGAYFSNTYTSGTINMLTNGFHGDCYLELDFSASSASNSAAFYLPLLSQDSNWHFPVYLRSHATNYKLRFDNYSGDGGTNKRDEYTTSYAYGTTQNLKIKFNYDETNDYISSYSVYLNGNLIDLFDNCIIMSKGNFEYAGIKQLIIRNTISLKNIKLYTGEKLSSNDPSNKYIGVNVTGENTLATPRKSDYLTAQYEVKNIFDTSLNSDASWSLSPSNQGVTVNSDGIVSVAKTAIGGNYTLTAIVNGTEYSKNITVSAVEYVLNVTGKTEIVRDFTHISSQLGQVGMGGSGGIAGQDRIAEQYTAVDQFGEPVKVDWTFENASAFSYSLSKLSDNVGKLILNSNLPDGTYTLKATADPSEGMTNPVATLDIVVKAASYDIIGPDTIVVSDNSCNVVEYSLKSSIGNVVTRDLNWRSDDACILPDGKLIASSQLPSSFSVSVTTNQGTHTKDISVTSSGSITGTSFVGSLDYSESNKFPLQNGKNEKTLSADLVNFDNSGSRLDDSILDIEWSIVDISGYSDGSRPDATIDGSKLVVNGKCNGTITVQGILKHTPIKTEEITINLTDAFAVVENSALKLNGEANEEFIIKHYMPSTLSFVDAVFETQVSPNTSTSKIASDGTYVTVNPDFSRPGMHKFVIENGSGDLNEITVMINDDKLFYQNDVKDLLTNNRIKDYLKIYSQADVSLIEECTLMYSSMTSEQKDAVLLLTNKTFSDYYTSVKLINFLSGSSDDTDSIKTVLLAEGLDTKWVDVLASDVDRNIISQNVINSVKSLELVGETVILQAVKNSSVTNPKEVKPYLAVCNSSKYKNADETGKNTIAGVVSGQNYATMQALLNAIDNVNISKPSYGGGSSGSGGKTQTGSIGGYVSAPTPALPDGPNNIYNDVSSEHWAFKYINSLSKKGIINGFDGNMFMPEANVTRAEFVKILVEAFSVAKSQNTPFTDVNSSDWFAPYIAGAYDIGLVIGDGQNFRPNEQITRQDAAVMIYRFATHYDYKFEAIDNSFTDKSAISGYATDAVNALVSASVINGMPDGSFAPESYATRAEAAKMIFEILEKGGNK